MASLDTLAFDNTFQRLPEQFYSRVLPQAVRNPRLVGFNSGAAALIDLDSDEAQNDALVDYFSGKSFLPGSDPVATAYAGHQFGSYMPQLGDGRALLIGEVRNRDGNKWDLVLKGAGPTPYARMGDGRAGLSSTIREYLAGEALAGLGIPGSRALCIIGSDQPIMRSQPESAALLARLAPSHIRFGHFQYCRYGLGECELKMFADYVLQQHLPHLLEQQQPYLALFEHTVMATAKLIAQWMAVGFVHGVMNTDNMSILGLTLDYGTNAFLQAYDPEFVANQADDEGRYAFKLQPWTGYRNLQHLAIAMLPLAEPQALKEILGRYEQCYQESYGQLMCDKLGLANTQESRQLLTELLQFMQQHAVDYTNFFRRLCVYQPGDDNTPLHAMFGNCDDINAWLNRYRRLLSKRKTDLAAVQKGMKKVNPKYILRNYQVETAIHKARQGDCSELDRLLAFIQSPCEEMPEYEDYAVAEARQ
ncbi:MAG: protein adenylyltransferase SelO [Pseudomonadales bacterium]